MDRNIEWDVEFHVSFSVPSGWENSIFYQKKNESESKVIIAT